MNGYLKSFLSLFIIFIISSGLYMLNIGSEVIKPVYMFELYVNDFIRIVVSHWIMFVQYCAFVGLVIMASVCALA